MGLASFRLFGRFSAVIDGQPPSGIETCKLQELLSYLLLYRSAPHPREVLAALLWGDSSTAKSKKYLRHALWQLHSTLACSTNGDETSVLTVEPDWIQLNPDADVWLDVAFFDQAFEAARGVMGRELDDDRAAALREAVDLYVGDLLEGWYHDWCICERERLQSEYLIMLDKLIGYADAHDDFEAGIAYGLRSMRLERARESTHRRLMRLYFFSGDRTAALRQYDKCVMALDEELGVAPASRTVALYERIRADTLTRGQESGVTVDAAAAPRIAVVDRLRRIRSALKAVRREIKKDIEAVNKALGDQR